jgi:hypothetical protein
VNAAWTRSANLALGALALGSCTQAPPSATPCLPADLFALAARHYRAHNPPEVLKLSGGRLSFIIVDQGDQWEVWVGPYGFTGSGPMMLIRKADMQVEVTQIRGQ